MKLIVIGLPGSVRDWVEFTDDVAIDSILDGDWLGGESAEKTLVRVLASREEWLPQLWAHGLVPVARVAR